MTKAIITLTDDESEFGKVHYNFELVNNDGSEITDEKAPPTPVVCLSKAIQNLTDGVNLRVTLTDIAKSSASDIVAAMLQARQQQAAVAVNSTANDAA